MATYGHLIQNSKKFINGGVKPDEGEELIASGKGDGIMFGALWLSHPDVTNRIRLGQPLDNQIDFSHLFGFAGRLEEQRTGYTDYPAAV